MLARLIPLAVLTCLWISPSPGHAQDRPLPGLENLQTFVATADSADLPRLQALVDTLAAAGDLRLVSSQQDRYVAGLVHDTFQQFHQGVPVLGGSVSRQRDGGAPGSVIGTMYRDIDVDVTPGLSATEAVSLVRHAADAEPATSDLPELVILQTLTGRYALVWSVTMGDFHRYFLDAHSGAVVERHPLIKHQSEVGAGRGIQGVEKKLSISRAGGRFEAHDRLRPAEIVTLDLRLDEERSLSLLLPLGVIWSADDVAASPDNTWHDDAVVDAHAYTGFTYDHLFREHGWRGVDGRDGRIMNMVNMGGDFGYDNAFYIPPPFGPEGTGVFSYGRWTDGLPLTSADIVGHELMHGVAFHALLERTGSPPLPTVRGILGPPSFELNGETATCADRLRLTSGPDGEVRRVHLWCEKDRLVLASDHGGAFAEAYADVIGTAVEFDLHAGGSGPLQADYLSGEDTGFAIRSLSDPASRRLVDRLPPDYDGPAFVNPTRPDAYQRIIRFLVGIFDDTERFFFLPFGSVDGVSVVRLPSTDDGGVHFNSTILSHAFYLAVEGGRNRTTGLTVDGAGAANFALVERAFFRAVTQLMPPRVNMFQAANLVRLSALQMYGADSATFLAIHQAFNAVGLTIDPPGA